MQIASNIFYTSKPLSHSLSTTFAPPDSLVPTRILENRDRDHSLCNRGAYWPIKALILQLIDLIACKKGDRLAFWVGFDEG
jgi:hypothetical protein